MTAGAGPAPRDHGGRIDGAVQRFGGTRAGWLDLSTGINPMPWPLAPLPDEAWTALPDQRAEAALVAAARCHWQVPEGAGVLAAPGASALIARLPGCLGQIGQVGERRFRVPGPTYNEHAAAFAQQGWIPTDRAAEVAVVVHPNNPDGRLWSEATLPEARIRIIDESFCDVAPEASMIGLADRPGIVILKSFGKFWGLAGLRLGFAIGDAGILAQLAAALGPWPVSGPALALGAAALADRVWAEETRARLGQDARRLDRLMTERGAQVVGGTALFRLYEVADATVWQERLARGHVWSRVFPYSGTWLRLGLPAPDRWEQLEAAI